jgi:outer membrane murein-binding lipoprotein Lpp
MAEAVDVIAGLDGAPTCEVVGTPADGASEGAEDVEAAVDDVSGDRTEIPEERRAAETDGAAASADIDENGEV